MELKYRPGCPFALRDGFNSVLLGRDFTDKLIQLYALMSFIWNQQFNRNSNNASSLKELTSHLFGQKCIIWDRIQLKLIQFKRGLNVVILVKFINTRVMFLSFFYNLLHLFCPLRFASQWYILQVPSLVTIPPALLPHTEVDLNHLSFNVVPLTVILLWHCHLCHAIFFFFDNLFSLFLSVCWWYSIHNIYSCNFYFN